jgi:general secretion pathway protein I
VRMRGFTLIEVIVALFIVAVGMAALMGAMTSAADTSVYLRDKMFAEWIALNRVEETRLAFRRPSKGKSDGEVEYAGRRWRWEQEVIQTEVPGILRIDVRVRPSDISAANKGSWFTTTSGIVGDAIEPPRGDLPEFRRPSGEPGGPQNPGEEPPPQGGDQPDPGTPTTPPPEPEPDAESDG